MDTLQSHYARLLGLDDSWRVESVDLQIEDRRVEIHLSHVGSGVICPECGVPRKSPKSPKLRAYPIGSLKLIPQFFPHLFEVCIKVVGEYLERIGCPSVPLR